MSKAWEKGSTWAWRKIRARVMEANRLTNGGRCTLAIAGVCTIWATCVHHTLGRAVTGDDPRYLQATCMPCNLRVGEPDIEPSSTTISRW